MMSVKKTNSLGISALLAAVCGFGLISGCGKDSDEPKYRELEGRVSSVDVSTGVVKMWWYSPEKRKEIELPGTLAPDAEILINGATARLGDLLVDDLVRVTGRAEKRDGETRYIATKVEVIRPPTTAPSAATQPAGEDSKANK